MFTGILPLIFDRSSLRGLQLFWPVALLPVIVALIDVLRANHGVVTLLVVLWVVYLLSTYGKEGWYGSCSANRNSLDIACNITQGIGALLLPLILLGALGLCCRSCFTIPPGSVEQTILSLCAVTGATAAVLLFLLFIPATTSAFLGSVAYRTRLIGVGSSYGGISLGLLAIVLGCCSIVAGTQIFHRLIATLSV